MANRQWRVTGNFHRVGEVAVIVTSPNWQGALRKGALEIKRSPMLKGRRLNKGVFTVNEQETVAEAITGEQANLPVLPGTQPVEVPVVKCSNPNCNQAYAHEGMCDNYVPETQEESNVEVAIEAVEPPKES